MSKQTSVKLLINKLLKRFCKHKWKVIYTYNLTADYQCKKCGKTKKDFIIQIKK